jgi:hypothetical protein
LIGGCLAANSDRLLSVFAEDKQVCVDFHYSVGGRLARLLLDTGAGLSYVSSTFVTERGLAQNLSADSYVVSGAFGNVLTDNRTALVPLCLEGIGMSVSCCLAPLFNFNIILGRDWISEHVVSTNWSTNEWLLHTPNLRVVSFYPKSFSFSFSSVQHLLSIADKADTRFTKENLDRQKTVIATDCYLNLISDGTLLGPRDDIPAEFPSCFPGPGKFHSDLLTLTKCFSPLFEEISKAPDCKRVIMHLVDTGNAQPVYQPVRQLSPALLRELKTRLEKLQAAGFIRPSTSPWSAPILLAKNPNSGKLRLCVDYRHLMR